MNITAEEWTPEEMEEDLTPESLVSRLLNQSPTLDNYIRGMESMQILLEEAVNKHKQNE